MRKRKKLPSSGRNAKIEQFLAVFVLIDICLLPYIRQLSCITSMLAILVWYVLNLRSLRVDKEMAAFLITILLMGISMGRAYVQMPTYVAATYQSSGAVNVMRQTITYSILLVYTYLYYFFFREVLRKDEARAVVLYKTFRVLYVAITCLAILYLVNPTVFYRLRTIWTLSGRILEASEASSTHYRYTFSFSDPNNLAMMVTAMMILILERKGESRYFKYAAFMMCALVLVATMSVQGCIAFALYWGVKGVMLLRRRKTTRGTVFFAIGLIVVGLLALVWIESDSMIVRAIGRIVGNENSMLIRLRIWWRILSNIEPLEYLLAGKGCVIEVNDLAVVPHNGHIYLFCAYGLIAYALFWFVFFGKKERRKWVHCLFLLPLFVCFSINIGLIDARYTFMMGACTAIGHALCKQNHEERPKEKPKRTNWRKRIKGI